MDIEKTRTTPWHPQNDHMIERLNITLETLVTQSITEDQKNWVPQTPLCCMAYRAAETTRRTPNFLMLGLELPMPSVLLSLNNQHFRDHYHVTEMGREKQRSRMR